MKNKGGAYMPLGTAIPMLGDINLEKRTGGDPRAESAVRRRLFDPLLRFAVAITGKRGQHLVLLLKTRGSQKGNTES